MTRSIAFRRRARLGATVAAAGFCLLCAVPRAFAADPVRAASVARAGDVVVRVYDGADLPGRDVREANRVAARILRQGGIAVRWLHCGALATRSDADACSRPLGPGEVLLRLSLSTSAPDAAPTSLGFTLLDRSGRSTIVATVFVDRILRVAGRVQVDPTVLAGRAMAHEIGHVLLGNSGHAARGLMRSVWSDRALTSQADEDWQLQPDEIESIHHRSQVTAGSFDPLGGS